MPYRVDKDTTPVNFDQPWDKYTAHAEPKLTSDKESSIMYHGKAAERAHIHHTT